MFVWEGPRVKVWRRAPRGRMVIVVAGGVVILKGR